MIRCLLIGRQKDIRYYSGLIARISYFGEQAYYYTDREAVPEFDINRYDAILLVSPAPNYTFLLHSFIKAGSNIYFVDQPAFSEDLEMLLKLQTESDNLIYAEIKELNHPLIQDFIQTTGDYLQFSYSKSVPGKRQIRPALLNALGFITLLSPLQVKKIDIETGKMAEEERPAFKIRLKLFDSSAAYIMLKLENKNEHHIIIESKAGNFTFNFAENYIENVHGARFTCDPVTEDDLISNSLKSFAICMIMNRKPPFTFYHYTLLHYLLDKLLCILPSDF